ncbi:MAG: DUF4388 domain-containing protein, partial [Myxococcota bacterium]
MNTRPAFSVELYQPNQTVRRLMSAVLGDVGVEVREPEEQDALASILIVDAAALGEERIKRRFERYTQSEQPVLVSGLTVRRDAYVEQTWLERPFSASALVYECEQLLSTELKPRLEQSLSLESSGAIETREEPHRAMKEGPPTREIDIAEVSILEEELGLKPGVLGTPAPNERAQAPGSSSARELEELSGTWTTGGQLVGKPTRAAVELDTVEVRAAKPGLGSALLGSLSVSAGGSLEAAGSGEVPADGGLSVEGAEDTDPSLSVQEASGPGFVEVLPLTAEVMLQEDEGEARRARAQERVDDETSRELETLAAMLARSFSKIALTSRTEDRTERLSRVLHAMFEGGPDGAARELERIPQAQGFTGSLSVLSLMGVFNALRERRLRGRLEVSTAYGTYVMYVDGGWLVDIDALAEDAELMLLDILYEHGALDAESYTGLRDASGMERLMAPVEMRLLSEELVTDAALAHAKALRARKLFGQVCRSRRGSFAFIEVRRGSAEQWPVHELKLNVDELVLDLTRESSYEPEVSGAAAWSRLAVDARRVRALGRGALTLVEQKILEFFRDGETLETAYGLGMEQGE